MSVTQKIQKQINRLSEGSTFKYDQLTIDPEEYSAAAKAIERLIEKGIIKRVSTGLFYKPKQSVFGELKPSEGQILKPYLFEKGKRIAYITGTSLYNRLGLTTQIPQIINIASRDKRISISIGDLKTTAVKAYVDVTDKNYYLLELLDVLKDFNKIPDLDKASAIKIITNKLEALNSAEIKLLVKCSLAYPPRARSFLGALLEEVDASTELSLLRKSLSPFSEYEFGIENNLLSTAKNWRIK